MRIRQTFEESVPERNWRSILHVPTGTKSVIRACPTVALSPALQEGKGKRVYVGRDLLHSFLVTKVGEKTCLYLPPLT